MEHVARMGEGRKTHRVLTAKPEGKRLLGRPSCTWENDIKTHLKGKYGEGVDWIDLAQDGHKWRAVVNTLMNFWLHKMQGILCLAEEVLLFEKDCAPQTWLVGWLVN